MTKTGLWSANGLDGFNRTESGLIIPRKEKRLYSAPVAVDLFCGAGGMSLGLHEAGFHVAAAVEFDEWAAITYTMNLARPGVKFHFDTEEREIAFAKAVAKSMGLETDEDGCLVFQAGKKVESLKNIAGSGYIKNHPGQPACEHFWIADVRNVTGQQILDALGLERGDVALVTGGPPCQGYSRIGTRDVMDPRNSLVFEFARLVLEIRPKAFMMENVPGMVDMVTPEGIPVIDALCRVLDDGDFGTYEALKRGLLATSGAGMGVRGSGSGQKNDAPGVDQQLELFKTAGVYEEAM